MAFVDEHYYSSPEFFLAQADKYDTYDRHGPKIYVGEYAVTQGCGQGNLRAAIAEAPRDADALRARVLEAPHAQVLRALGAAYAADVEWCAQVDVDDVAREG